MLKPGTEELAQALKPAPREEIRNTLIFG